jgi:hypothetical protein
VRRWAFCWILIDGMDCSGLRKVVIGRGVGRFILFSLVGSVKSVPGQGSDLCC